MSVDPVKLVDYDLSNMTYCVNMTESHKLLIKWVVIVINSTYFSRVCGE